MKMTAKLVLAAAIGASVGVVCAWADGDDNAAYSANAVGVVKYTVPANGALTCVSLPLNPLTNTNWLWGETSLANQLESGSIVYFWNTTKMGWDPYSKSKMFGWNDKAKNHVIQPGEAFFIQTANTDGQVISLLGELPTEEDYAYPVVANTLQVFTTSPYPVEKTFGTSSLASNLPASSTVYFWNQSKRGWDPYSKSKMFGWNDKAKAITNFVGEGIFVKSSETTDVTFDRPFEW